jgi:phage baseplate assembly protein V
MSAPLARSRSTEVRYHGVYEALVADVNDPLEQGRIKIRMPWFDEQMVTEWCRVRQFYAGNGYGAFFIPEVGDEVLIAFIQGDMRYPVILGGLYNGHDKPPSQRDDRTDQKLVRTKAGHVLLFDDSSGKERVRITTKGGHELDLSDADHTVSVTSAGGHTVKLEDQEQTITIQTSGQESITMEAGKITLSASSVVISGPPFNQVLLGGDDAGSPLVLGDLFMSLFNTHTHGDPLSGFTTPPVVPMTNVYLSRDVKTK